MDLLIAGGLHDPNLAALAEAAGELGITIADARAGEDALEFSWDLSAGSARLRGEPLGPRAAFLRHDVFSSLHDPRPAIAARALGWSQALQGWLYARPDIRVFNRHAAVASSSKPAMLCHARQAGLSIPATQITNSAHHLRKLPAGTYIAKPVAGGDYCYTLEESLKRLSSESPVAPMPAIVQPRLVAPEIRVYIVGRRTFAFEMRSSSLDYRVTQDAVVLPTAVPAVETAALQRLLAEVKMDFGAADFKTDPATGGLVFLELNTSPMFARFNAEVKGELCRAMITELLEET